MTWGRLYWPFFIIVTSALFLGPELIATFTNRANTLSEYAWAELRVSGLAIHDIAWYISIVAWLLFVVVITAHIWWRSFS